MKNIFIKTFVISAILVALFNVWLVIEMFIICPNEKFRIYFGIETYECFGEAYDVSIGLMYYLSFIIVGLLILAFIVHNFLKSKK